MTDTGTSDAETYGDTPFVQEGDVDDRADQSRFIASITIEHLPRWLIEQAQQESFTVADWGCSQGDMTDIWASHIGAQHIVGIDYSPIAIAQAAQRYPEIRFMVEYQLANENQKGRDFDVVFFSDLRQRLPKLSDALHSYATRAKKAIVLALPHMAVQRIEDGIFSFPTEKIQVVLQNGFRLAWLQVIDCRAIPKTFWSGDHVIVVYADPQWMNHLGLPFNDCQTEPDNTAAIVNRMNHVVVKREVQIGNRKVVFPKMQLLGLKSSIPLEKAGRSRFESNMFQNPKTFIYDLAKFLFWQLPPGARQALHGPRHKYVRWVKGLPPMMYSDPQRGKVLASDLSWEEFSVEVLSHRQDYKGVFVQEFAINWNVPLYQRPHHIATALGRLGYLVIYKTDNWGSDRINGFREVAANVWLTNRNEVNNIEGAVISFYSTAFTLTPKLMVERSKKGGVLVYEYIDHIDSQISGDVENIRRLHALKEFAFKGGADYIVASARKLEAEAVESAGLDKVILAQNGVDTIHYRDPIHLSTPLPANLTSFKKKYSNIVGYFGALAPWLWYEAISWLIKTRPDLGFVIVGPDYYGGVRKLPKADNLLYLGTVDYRVLPAYARQFDICFIPFAPGEIARTTSPLKLFEYFALEKPVVVTSEMLECVAYSEVFSGNSPAALSRAIDAAIHVKNDASFKTRLALLADENNWNERARALEIIFERLKENDKEGLVCNRYSARSYKNGPGYSRTKGASRP
ncbi:methyltransferase [Nitrosospira sp. Is2]|uniref:methyltransferase n=1 Tax=Nitrosospira sp. Is2 TaxID=3080532 RepID=UPI0029538480|nr:methyltransferase domain-containing protein [Nitrosospira sp. Is2]WON72809.1 methyltransferase domain-containing protein [Nitrosospira sp. Is2]